MAALKRAAMTPQIVIRGTGPTLYLAIGAVAYTSLRVQGKTAPPKAVPMYMTVATAVTARVTVVYPGTKLYTYAKTKPPRIKKTTCAMTGVWVLGLTWLRAFGRTPSIDIATATRVQPTMTLNTTWIALSMTPMIIRNRRIGLSVSMMANELNQGGIGGWGNPELNERYAAAPSQFWSTVRTITRARTAIMIMLTAPPPKLMNIWFFRLCAPWISPACSCAYPTHPRLVRATGVTRIVAAIEMVRSGVKLFAIAFERIAA